MQFSHTIDELISFDTQFKSYLKSLDLNEKSSKYYTCLHLICENSLIFNQWINLERQVCQKKVDLIFSAINQCSINLLNQTTDESNQIDNKSNKLSLFNDNTSDNFEVPAVKEEKSEEVKSEEVKPKAKPRAKAKAKEAT